MRLHLIILIFYIRELFSSVFEDYIEKGKQIKVYVHPNFLTQFKSDANGSPYYGKQLLNNETSILSRISPNLYIHSEYISSSYMKLRALHDPRLHTTNIEDAHMCYPSCSGEVPHPWKYGNPLQFVQFHVRDRYKPQFSGCRFIGFFIEPPEYVSEEISNPLCWVMAPYVHSIYIKKGSSHPWGHRVTRNILLSFVGGSRHGGARTKALRSFHHVNLTSRNDFPINSISASSAVLFETTDKRFLSMERYSNSPTQGDVVSERKVLVESWEVYARSVFAWHPRGDSPTRRAFYDSWLLGCIPVVAEEEYSNSLETVYDHLFNGILFTLFPLKEMIIAVPLEIFYDAEALLSHLASYSKEEVELRRTKMSRAAPYLQWGWTSGEGDALNLVFASLMTQVTKAVYAPTPQPTGSPVNSRSEILSPSQRIQRDKAWCFQAKKTYAIIPGESFGTLPISLQNEYILKHCIVYFR